MSLHIYCVHWSDNLKEWGKPHEARHLDLGLPFGYFLAKNDKEAQNFVKELKPLVVVHPSNYFPRDFHLGSIEIRNWNTVGSS